MMEPMTEPVNRFSHFHFNSLQIFTTFSDEGFYIDGKQTAGKWLVI